MVSRSYFGPLSLQPVTEELRIWFAKIKKPSGVIEGCVPRESGESHTSQIQTSGSFRLIHLIYVDAVTEVAEADFLLEYHLALPQRAVDGIFSGCL